MSTLIGLTGGIGSGKSLAASYFKELGAIIIYADCISRQLVEPGQAAWKEFSNGAQDAISFQEEGSYTPSISS